MQVVFHLGVHCTDNGALARCLEGNRDLLAAEGIAAPAPASYQALLRDASAALDGKVATRDTAQSLLDAIVEDDAASRVVFSFESFMAFPRWALARNQFYPGATDRTSALANLFPGHQVEFCLGLRNPATYLPALFERQKGKIYEDFIEGSDPLLLRWSELVGRIMEASPSVPLTLWCDEDTPLIWPEVLREVSGHDALTRLQDTQAILAAIMSPEGFARMNDYLTSHPPQTEIQRRRIVSAFLDKFALPEAIEVELDLPGWTDDYVSALTAAYDEDMARIMRLPGVNFITP